MSRIQQKRTGIRITRARMDAKETASAINRALDRMGIARPRWGSNLKDRPDTSSAKSEIKSEIRNLKS